MILNQFNAELTGYNFWVPWRLEFAPPMTKPTKRPYAASGWPCDITKSQFWLSYEQASALTFGCNEPCLPTIPVAQTGFTGLGFVFDVSNPFTGIDIDPDKLTGPTADQIAIYNSFASYSEYSPSGVGIHIIVKGSLPIGKRRDGVEVYSHGRYFTMTGNVLNPMPIMERQDLLDKLFLSMGGNKSEYSIEELKVEAFNDEQILKMATEAVNGDKFQRLWLGNWKDEYKSQSEADIAIYNMLAFYSKHFGQSNRLFRQSELGKRDKAQRDDYCRYMFNKSFDNALPEISQERIDSIMAEMLSAVAAYGSEPGKLQPKAYATALATHDATGADVRAIGANVNGKSGLPGLLGRISNYIYDAAPRQVRLYADVGAIGLLSGLCGRSFNVNGAGLNQYMLMLGGTGCHAKGTGILMFDGSIKLVENIVVADKLMGPDSEPREVLSLARGREQMVRIVPTKGKPFYVNISHILNLKHTVTKKYINITVRHWLKQNANFKHCYKLHRKSVMFKNWYSLPLDPWFLGAMLGDGSFVSVPNITSQDWEIHKACEVEARRLGLDIRNSQIEGNSSRQSHFVTTVIGKNPMTEIFRKLNLWGKRSGDKFIPEVYKTASRKDRLSILAGLIDTDGSLSCGGYDYISKSEQLSNDVMFVARSLGFAAYITKCEKYSQNDTGGWYYRVSISGDTTELPLLLDYKKSSKRQQKKNVLVTGIYDVQLQDEDNYYGFNLSGDHLYLTDDFTVHHNTGKEGVNSAVNAIYKELRITTPPIDNFIGAAELVSAQGVAKSFIDKPCQFMIVGEIGKKIAEMTDPRANPNIKNLSSLLLKFYSFSGHGQVSPAMAYSDRGNNIASIASPSLTLLGESVPGTIYDNLSDTMVSDGLLPRFLIWEYKGPRVLSNENRKVDVPLDIINDLAGIVGTACTYSAQGLVMNIPMTAEAEQIFRDFDTYTTGLINHAHSGGVAELWNRAHLKAFKLAGVVAISLASDSKGQMLIDIEIAQWATKQVFEATCMLTTKFDTGEIGITENSDARQLMEIRKILGRYLVNEYKSGFHGTEAMKQQMIITESHILQRCAALAAFRHDRIGSTGAVKRAIKVLLDGAELQTMPKLQMKERFGCEPLAFIICNPAGVI